MTDAEKERTAGMFDQLSSTYGEIVPFFSYFGERLVAAAGVAEGDAVLDVASGLGACLLPASAMVGEDGRVVGIDISREMVHALNRAIETSGCRNANVQLMDAEALRFTDDSFDRVTSRLNGSTARGERASGMPWIRGWNNTGTETATD